jgi:hypothetical protein
MVSTFFLPSQVAHLIHVGRYRTSLAFSKPVSVLATQVVSMDGVYFVPAFLGNWFNPCRK